MLKVAALDDEYHVLERFEETMQEFDNVQICGLFQEEEELKAYLENSPLDIVFLDIEMPGKSGLQLAGELHCLNSNIAVVFVTAYTQYALEAFELSVLDYIVKPVSKERMKKTLNHIEKLLVPRRGSDAGISISCFPRFECRVNETVLALNHLMKAKELLAFLVSRKGAETSWDMITESLWPDTDYEKAHNNLYITTYRLRKWLAENNISQIFECRRNSYRVVPSEFHCDYFELEKAWKEKGEIKQEIRGKGEFLEEDGYVWAYPIQAELAQR